jgi:phytanoyl-CoA hydroxylase
MCYDFPHLTSIGPDEIERFRRDGYLVVERFMSEDRIEALRNSFPKLFAGKFDTGVFPDEWYWREGMSLPDVTRHMTNAWKADLTVAKLALSTDIGHAAALLTGWSGSRLGQDTIWWKPPKTKPVSHHQDSSFMDFLSPPRTITCWVTLDDTHREAGALEYVPGSHLWPLTPIPDDFHAPDDYRGPMKHAAREAGVEVPEPTFIEVPAGSCVFHSGEIWHGSGPNTTGARMRRSIGIHMVPSDATFSNRHGGYIYRRYQRTGDPALDESFFPIVWCADGHRTNWINAYCETGRR